MISLIISNHYQVQYKDPFSPLFCIPTTSVLYTPTLLQETDKEADTGFQFPPLVLNNELDEMFHVLCIQVPHALSPLSLSLYEHK